MPSPDCALIIDGYNAVGEAVENADAKADADDFAGRWLAVRRAVREWALAHPHEYALLHGTPVPGYKAPEDTVSAAVRDTVVLARIITEAYAAEAIDLTGPRPPTPPSLTEDLGRVRSAVRINVPDDVVARAMTAWAGLYGTVSFEVFGQFNNVVVDDRAAYFDHAMLLLGRLVGLKP